MKGTLKGTVMDYWMNTHHHGQASGEDTGMLDHTVSGLEHALDLAALSALRQPLHTLTEVAECPVLLFPDRKMVQKNNKKNEV